MNKIIYTLLTIITFSFISINANAETVIGIISCGKWIKQKEINRGSQLVAMEEWLDGYLSGLAVGSNTDILKQTDFDSLHLWVNNYCRANPLRNVSDAGVELFNELKKQKGL